MAFLIDQLNNSGLFAQSAYSAGIATCDSDGNVITATYLTGVDLTPYQTTAGMTAYATTGDVENKLDTTSFSDVSGTFLTAHQSLDGYATTAWVDSQGYLTAHQPISANEWNNVYDTVNVYSGAWTGSESSPTASVDSNGSIDIVSSNNTVYFDVNGTWFNDAVNSALPTSAVQWNSNYNTVNTNSGVWGGSALPISAGPGIKVDLVDNTLVFRNDETVLWEGTRTSAIQTSESMKNFDKCQVYIAHSSYGPPQIYTIDFADMGSTGYFVITRPRGSVNLNIACIRLTADDTHLATVNSKCLAFGSWTSTATGVTATTGEAEDLNSIIKVIGINRINNV